MAPCMLIQLCAAGFFTGLVQGAETDEQNLRDSCDDRQPTLPFLFKMQPSVSFSHNIIREDGQGILYTPTFRQ